ncbi:MAG: VanZ family protein [Chitinophagaceae bacterium]
MPIPIKQIFLWRLLTLLWWIITFYLMIMPPSDLPTLAFSEALRIDKFVHISMFAILAVGLMVVFPERYLPVRVLWVSIIAVGYGVLMELVQLYFVPFRSFEWLDIVADTVGTIIGVRLGKKIGPRRNEGRNQN